MASEVELERMMVRLVGDGSSFQKMMSDGQKQMAAFVASATSAMESFKQSAQKSSKDASKEIESFATTALTALGALEAKSFVLKIFSQFQETEQGILRLRSAITASGRDVETAMPVYEEFIQKLKETTGASADATRGLLTMMEAQGYGGDAARQSVQTATTLAIAYGGNAEEYLRIQEALASGQAHLIGRAFHQELRGATSDAEKLARVARLVAKSGPIAAANMESSTAVMKRFEGSIKALTKQFGNLIAEAFVPAAKGATFLIEQFTKLDPTFQRIFAGAAIAVAGLVSIGPAWAGITKYIYPVVTLMRSGISSMIGAVTNLIPSLLSAAYGVASFVVSMTLGTAASIANAAATGVLTVASIAYNSVLTGLAAAQSIYATSMLTLSIPVMIVKYSTIGLVIGALVIYEGAMLTISAVQRTYAGVTWLAVTATSTITAIFSISTLKTLAYASAYVPLNAINLVYVGILGIVKLATAAWAVVTAIASGGLSILGGVVVVVGGLIFGVLIAAMTAALSPILALIGGFTALIGVTAGIAAIAGVGQIVAVLAAMVQAFNDEDLGKPMKEALKEIWSMIKLIGMALTGGFGLLNIGQGWRGLVETAQRYFLNVTDWILDNKITFMNWAYSIGQIGRSVFDALAATWRWFLGLLQSGLGAVFGSFEFSISGVMSFVTTTLNYIATALQNLELVWEIIKAGFRLAWASVTTMSVWKEWKVRAFMIFEEVKNYLTTAFYTAWTVVRSTFLAILPPMRAAFLELMASLVLELANSSLTPEILAGPMREEAARLRGQSANITRNSALENEMEQTLNQMREMERLRASGGAFNQAEYDRLRELRYAQQQERAGLLGSGVADTAGDIARLQSQARLDAQAREIDFMQRELELAVELRYARESGDRGAVDAAQREMNRLTTEFQRVVAANPLRLNRNSTAGRDAGTDEGRKFNQAMGKELAKFDAAEYFSAESFGRIQAYMDRLNFHKIGAITTTMPGGTEARGVDAQAEMINQRWRQTPQPNLLLPQAPRQGGGGQQPLAPIPVQQVQGNGPDRVEQLLTQMTTILRTIANNTRRQNPLVPNADLPGGA